GDRSDAGRALRGPVLRRRGRRARVLPGHAGRLAPHRRSLRRAAHAARAAGRRRRSDGEHLIADAPDGPLRLLKETAIERLTSDSRRAGPGAAFFAWPGASGDGRRHIAQAVERGCGAVLWESEGFAWDKAWSVPNAGLHGLRAQAGFIAHEFFGRP